MTQCDRSPMAKRDFGSFHASNVQELLYLSEEKYIPPTIPIALPDFSDVKKTRFLFGKKAKQQYFFLEDNCCFLNHGAFGAVLRPALGTVRLWQEYVESQPLRFYDRELLPLLVHVSRRLAQFVGCDAQDLVLINNATFGTNSVLNSMKFDPCDVILSFNITYGAVKKLIQHICIKSGAVNKEVNISFPLTGKEQILELLETELSEKNIKLVVIDHIPSNAPIILPVQEMVQICRKRNVLAFIDGAHALGSLPLNLREIDPDFYVSNAHKWLSCPKGAAFLYVRRNLQEMVRPAVVSHGLGSGFNSEFVWSGLHDYSPLLSLNTVLDFWLAVGPQTIRNFMYKMARDGADVLTKSWQTKLPAPPDMFGCMFLVKLPSNIHSMFDNCDYSAAETIQNILYHHYNIEVPIKCVQGDLYVRLSAHIYNDIEDYQNLAAAVHEISLDKGNKLL